MPPLETRFHADARAFLARAGERLRAEEVANNQILGISLRVAANPDFYGDRAPVFATVEDGGQVVAALLWTPPFPIIVRCFEPPIVECPALAALAGAMFTRGYRPVGARLTLDESEAFVEPWCGLTDATSEIGMRQRLHVLYEVDDPLPPCPGTLRPAGPGDYELVGDWWIAFHDEAVPRDPVDPERLRALALRALEEGRTFIWDDGGPVSMVGKARPLDHGVAIAPVYTPPELRRRGYATACTAELTRRILAEGARYCCLYTDRDNPTSNAIYRRIGYRPLEDWLEIGFRYPGSGS